MQQHRSYLEETLAGKRAFFDMRPGSSLFLPTVLLLGYARWIHGKCSTTTVDLPVTLDTTTNPTDPIVPETSIPSPSVKETKVSVTKFRPPVSHIAALLLTDCNSRTYESDDEVFLSELMDPPARYAVPSIDIDGSTLVGQLKAYRPVLFRKLREAAGIPESLYADSLNFAQSALSCLSADSKSGQAFWVSHNEQVVVKTIKHYECKNMCRILDSYAKHMLSSEGKSCISAVLGLYRVQPISGGCKYFMVSRNVYPPSHVNSFGGIRKQFDLKGSTVGRRAAPTSRVMKDLDLMASGAALHMGTQARTELLRTLERDVQFLRKHGFMDYSLLVAVEVPAPEAAAVAASESTVSTVVSETGSGVPQAEGEGGGGGAGAGALTDSKITSVSDSISVSSRSNSRAVTSADDDDDDDDVHKGKLVLHGADGLRYHFGIIDFLQKYSFRKHLETFLKGLFDDSSKISCVAPTLYARRMLSFIARYSQ
jgi:Phosphatidylinositol-4-phosphate 5-Kinase